MTCRVGSSSVGVSTRGARRKYRDAEVLRRLEFCSRDIFFQT